MADICIRCGKQADGLLCPECAAPPVKKAKAERPKPSIAPVAPKPVAIPAPVVAPEPAAISEPAPVAAPQPPKPPKPAKAPKPPKPPKVKRVYSSSAKRRVKGALVVAVLAGLIVNFLPQIKSGITSGKDFVTSQFASDAAPKATVSPSPTATPAASPSEAATASAAPTESATPKPTQSASSGEVASGARSAVVASVKKCARATVYAPPGCPFAETIRVHGNSVDWSLSGTPKMTLVSESGGVQTLRVSGKAVAHVHYGKIVRDVDHSFTRTAIATPSGATYTIKWK